MGISKSYAQLSIKDVSCDGDSSGFISFSDRKVVQKIHKWQKHQSEYCVLIERSDTLELFEGVRNSG